MKGSRETPIGASVRSRKPTVRRGARSGGAADASSTPPGAKAAAQRKQQPSADEIARRAYDIFLARGAIHGSDFDDWLQAEQELMQRRRSGTKKK